MGNLKQWILNSLIITLLFGVIAQLYIWFFYQNTYDVTLDVTTSQDGSNQIEAHISEAYPTTNVNTATMDENSHVYITFDDITQAEKNRAQFNLESYAQNNDLNIDSIHVDMDQSSSNVYNKLLILNTAGVLGLITGALSGLFLRNNDKPTVQSNNFDEEGKDGLVKEDVILKEESLQTSENASQSTKNNLESTHSLKLIEEKESESSIKEPPQYTNLHLKKLSDKLTYHKGNKLLLHGQYGGEHAGVFGVMAAKYYTRLGKSTLIVNLNHTFTNFFKNYYKNDNESKINLMEIVDGDLHIDKAIQLSIYGDVNIINVDSRKCKTMKMNEFVDRLFVKLRRVETRYDYLLVVMPNEVDNVVLQPFSHHIDMVLEDDAKNSNKLFKLGQDHVDIIEM